MKKLIFLLLLVPTWLYSQDMVTLKVPDDGTGGKTFAWWLTNSMAQKSATITQDVSNANAVANTLADITGLSFPVTAGTRYRFEFFIKYTSAATTTGSRWVITGPATTNLDYYSFYTIGASTVPTWNFLTAYNQPAAANATSLLTGNIAVIKGTITPSATGTVQARFASEVTISAIVAKSGSYVIYEAY